MRSFVAALALLLGIVSAHAQLPSGFVETSAVTGLNQPISIAFAPDGRMFIAQKGGAIRIFKNGALLTAPFATISVSTNSERGLLGIALDPQFASNHFVYVYYTTNANSLNAPATPKNRVSRLTANGDVAIPNSELILIDNIPSDAGNHNAGCLRFGLDGKLYISTGDGGSTPSNSQTLANLAGKILRLNSNGTIPSDNPFVGQTGVRPEIFVYGLRNPFRFSFRPGSNVMYIADVGQSTWEEVNVGQAAANYGWPITEGPTVDPRFVGPMFSYRHTAEQRASITGGCFVTSGNFPEGFAGSYFFGDFVRNTMRRLVVTSANGLVTDHDFGPAPGNVDFAQGPDGDLYYVSLTTGTVRRISYRPVVSAFTTPSATVHGGEPLPIAVTLSHVAPVDGASVVLSSSHPSLYTLNPIGVPSGATTASTSLATVGVASRTETTLTATLNGTGVTINVTLLPAVPRSLILSPSTVKAGSNTIARVLLRGKGAPGGGTQIQLAQNNPQASDFTSATLTVPAGASEVSRSFATRADAPHESAARVTASHVAEAVSVSDALIVVKQTLTGFSVSPTQVVGGRPATGTVNISGPAPAGGIQLMVESSSSAIQVPRTVTVPENAASTTFPISTSQVGSSFSRLVTVRQASLSRSASLTLTPVPLQALILNPNQVHGGSTTTGTVQLSSSAPSGGYVVTLSSNSSAIQVPSSVTVPAGQSSVNFLVQTSAVGDVFVRTVTATADGFSRAANLTLHPRPTLNTFTINPNDVVGGQSTTGTVTVARPTTLGSVQVSLTSGSSAIQVPPSVIIPQGSSSASFSITTSPVGSTFVRSVSATLNGVTRTASITLRPR